MVVGVAAAVVVVVQGLLYQIYNVRNIENVYKLTWGHKEGK